MEMINTKFRTVVTSVRWWKERKKESQWGQSCVGLALNVSGGTIYIDYNTNDIM